MRDDEEKSPTTNAAPAGTDAWIGDRLRAFRKRADMTLEIAAERAGLSASFVSRLEKGKRRPSIGVLVELGRVYGTNISELIGEVPDATFHLSRSDNGRRFPHSDGQWIALSGLGPTATLSAVMVILSPGPKELFATNRSTVHHSGERWLYVLSGTIRFAIGGEQMSLQRGDAVHFDARQPHRMANAGRGEARILLVSTSHR